MSLSWPRTAFHRICAHTIGVPFRGSPIVAGVIPGHDQVWKCAAGMATSLSAHLICAYVDPSSYLIEWTPGPVPVLP